MKILLNDSKIIREVQKEFNAEFPYLKIEFFDMPYIPKAPTPKIKMYDSGRKLGFCRKIHTEDSIDLNAKKTVAEVEKELWEKYGLSAQIFRKLGKLWIETNLTDAWTLEQQNTEGSELSFEKKEAADDSDDPTDRDQWQ